MQFYYLFPDRVDRLVLVSSGGLGREVNLVLRSATLPGAEQVLSVIASAPVLEKVEAVGRGAQKVGWKPGADIGAIWRGFTSLGDRESRRAFLATTRAVIDFGGQSISAHDHLGSVTPPPTLIVWGSKDRMIPAWHALSAQRALPDCRVELFEGAGHFPHLDDPDRFARVLREFMSAGPTARSDDQVPDAPPVTRRERPPPQGAYRVVGRRSVDVTGGYVLAQVRNAISRVPATRPRASRRPAGWPTRP